MIDVMLFHGISDDVEKDYYDSFVKGIRKHLPIDSDVIFHPINWNELIKDKERQIFEMMEGMAYQKFRKFGCDFIGDVLAYAPTEQQTGFYYEVNKMISEKIDDLVESHPGSNKVIISHSMGTQIAFSFCFQKPIDCLITMGSPILYFSVRFENFGSFPKDLKKMVNFYNVNDPVSTIISRNRNLMECEDVQVKSWNPKYLLPLKAHSCYWKLDSVHKKIADILNEM